jgi:hypothetical protein
MASAYLKKGSSLREAFPQALPRGSKQQDCEVLDRPGVYDCQPIRLQAAVGPWGAGILHGFWGDHLRPADFRMSCSGRGHFLWGLRGRRGLAQEPCLAFFLESIAFSFDVEGGGVMPSRDYKLFKKSWLPNCASWSYRLPHLVHMTTSVSSCVLSSSRRISMVPAGNLNRPKDGQSSLGRADGFSNPNLW